MDTTLNLFYYAELEKKCIAKSCVIFSDRSTETTLNAPLPVKVNKFNYTF